MKRSLQRHRTDTVCHECAVATVDLTAAHGGDEQKCGADSRETLRGEVFLD